MSRLIATVLVPDLLWQSARLEHPGLAGRPVVIGGRPGHRGAVAGVSPEARLRGVVPGQPMAAAGAHCPDATFLPGVVGPVIDLSAAVQTIVCDWFPEAAWLTPAHAIIDASTCPVPELHARLDRLRDDVRGRLSVLLACGIASNRVTADVAARLVPPGGVLHTLPGYEARMLAPVSLRHLDGVDSRLLARLAAARVTTFGDLAALDAGTATRLAGRGAVVLTRLARGDDPRPAPPAHPLGQLSLPFGARAGTMTEALAALQVRAAATGQRVAFVRARIVGGAAHAAGQAFVVRARGCEPRAWPARLEGQVVERFGTVAAALSGFVSLLLDAPDVATTSRRPPARPQAPAECWRTRSAAAPILRDGGVDRRLA